MLEIENKFIENFIEALEDRFIKNSGNSSLSVSSKKQVIDIIIDNFKSYVFVPWNGIFIGWILYYNHYSVSKLC